jgi:hypothetical protein
LSRWILSRRFQNLSQFTNETSTKSEIMDTHP